MKKSEDAAAAQAERIFSSNNNKVSKIPSHISPMFVMEIFLEKLTYASNDNGQVVVNKGYQF